MKKEFLSPEIEFVLFLSNDVITESGEKDDIVRDGF